MQTRKSTETPSSSNPNQRQQTHNISLPKGGGAIAATGEKFQSNPVTGSASTSIPIAISPGRAGFQPNLSLNYDSGNGNGCFGLGWSIGHAAIQRKTSRGIPRYREDDVFQLAGAEDLVPMYENGVPLRYLSPDEQYRIARFRPRIEGGFAKIEQWTRRSSGEVHWKITSTDNATTVFGQSSGARIAHPDDADKVFSWLPEYAFNAHGHIMRFTYKQENLGNVPPALHEQHRHAGWQAHQHRYLKAIHYGNTVPYTGQANFDANNSWLFQLVFNYGEHDPQLPTPAETQAWTLRPDPFSVYRAGFEQRRYRLCRSILMFHNFAELGPEPCLVKATELAYDENPVATRLISVTHVHFEKTPNGYTRAEMPPISLGYTEAEVSETVQQVDQQDGHDKTYEWMDLFGEGLPGMLRREEGSWYYRRNQGDGSFGACERMGSHPGLANTASARARLADLGGDRRLDLVLHQNGATGFHAMSANETWEPFKTFAKLPNVDWQDPNMRMLDLSGNGLPDIAITEDDCFRIFYSEGKAGYSSSETALRALDEKRGPQVVFADADQSVYTADMSGDGLTDILRIRNGEIAYWPNLGYGQFGAKVTMSDAPLFAQPGHFEQNRIRLGDIDGSGTMDLMYLHEEGPTFWLNQSGNSWSAGRQLGQFPVSDQISEVQVMDLLGKGTACLVWSSPLPDTSIRYIDLMGSKPYLLQEVNNNMGSLKRYQYAASTKFYLADRKNRRPWACRLPFPVQVVERTETYDEITGARFVNLFAYHHGYYDGEEREFRGFGMVEQWDTENYAGFAEPGLFPVGSNLGEEAAHVPPVYTKTWFHTGAYLQQQKLEAQYAREYFAGDALAWTFPETQMPAGLTGAEAREAARALKGATLRQEIYALDGSDKAHLPYSVSETNYSVQLLQPQGEEKHAAFLRTQEETLTYHYERDPADPRISHSIVLKRDAKYGMALQTASIVYPRRSFTEVEQGKMYITVAETDIFHADNQPEFYRIGLPQESRSYELCEAPVPTPLTAPIPKTDLRTWVANSTPVAFEGPIPTHTSSLRLLSRNRILYYNDDLSAPLPAGEIAFHGLAHSNISLVFSPGRISGVFGDKIDNILLQNEGKYQLLAGNWWTSSGQTTFDPAHFYLVTAETDPFGHSSQISYDAYDLFPVQITNALGHVVSGKYDYRVLQASEVTDPNGNRRAVAFDTRGMVVRSAIMGKQGSSDGDTLADPTVQMSYELFNWMQHRTPNYARSLAREMHGDPNSPWQESYVYTGGMGQEILSKIQAEPGLAFARHADGSLQLDAFDQPVLAMTPVRWVGNGRTIFDNKGNPVKAYEPYFSSTFGYEDEAEVREYGVTPVMHYDPMGRQIRVDHPNGTFSKVEFDPWMQLSYDENDTVDESQWYADRNAPLPTALPPTDPDERAAWLAVQHAQTPTRVDLDSLGRPFLTTVDNGSDGQFTNRVTLDLEGNTLSITDAQNRVVATNIYGMGGRLLSANTADAGTQFSFQDVMGRTIRTWNARGFTFRPTYDALHRPLETWMVAPGDVKEVLVNYLVYGDRLPNAAAQNQIGQVYASFDQSGLVRNESYDFKGQLRQQQQQFTREFKRTLDWADLAAISLPADILSAAAGRLSVEIFQVETDFDALGRPVRIATPDQSEVFPGYNQANLLETIDINLRGAAAGTNFVQNIDYDARGQRTAIHYGNGAHTTYAYEADTFRLARLRTTRNGGQDILQDLRYTYDPVGNITQMRDDAQQSHYFNNAVVSPETRYVYDALYRLVHAEGREHAGQGSQAQFGPADFPILNLPSANNSNAVRTYQEDYQYDGLGNILKMIHTATNGSWTRAYKYDEPGNNRLTGTTRPGTNNVFDSYTYDAHGNMLSMPNLAALSWDFGDRLKEVDLGGGGKARYVYGADGQRKRKVVIYQNGTVKERLYLSGFEIFREYVSEAALSSGNVKLERESLHVMDDAQRIALVETKTVDNGVTVSSPISLTRYQLGNHLGSASLELDAVADVISYEEFHPYGTSAYRAGRSAAEVALKRYRYTGKEKDGETGLYYHGARYYACWLGRWTAADPAGFVDGLNVYAYVRGNPVLFNDPTGRECGVTKSCSRKEPVDGDDDFMGPPAPSQEELAQAEARHHIRPLSEKELKEYRWAKSGRGGAPGYSEGQGGAPGYNDYDTGAAKQGSTEDLWSLTNQGGAPNFAADQGGAPCNPSGHQGGPSFDEKNTRLKPPGTLPDVTTFAQVRIQINFHYIKPLETQNGFGKLKGPMTTYSELGFETKTIKDKKGRERVVIDPIHNGMTAGTPKGSVFSGKVGRLGNQLKGSLNWEMNENGQIVPIFETSGRYRYVELKHQVRVDPETHELEERIYFGPQYDKSKAFSLLSPSSAGKVNSLFSRLGIAPQKMPGAIELKLDARLQFEIKPRTGPVETFLNWVNE